MSDTFSVQHFEKYSVVEFKIPSLMDPRELDKIGADLYRLIDEEDHRRIILDFEKVKYISSQAIGILMAMRKRLVALKRSELVLCSVNPALLQLLKITGLDKVLKVKPTQTEAVRVME
jgi:anti-sigma B factor antagonist